VSPRPCLRFISNFRELHPHHMPKHFPSLHTTQQLTNAPAILHTIFFHRYFTSISPLTRDLLDLTLPAIDDVDLETLIEQRTMALVRAIDSTHQQRGRGQLVVQFFEKKRKKAYSLGAPTRMSAGSNGRWTLHLHSHEPRLVCRQFMTLYGRRYADLRKQTC
jgi:hypothetical protein